MDGIKAAGRHYTEHDRFLRRRIFHLRGHLRQMDGQVLSEQHPRFGRRYGRCKSAFSFRKPMCIQGATTFVKTKL